jgi:hypothetical protein
MNTNVSKNFQCLSFQTKERASLIKDRPVNYTETIVNYHDGKHKRSFGVVKVVFRKEGL